MKHRILSQSATVLLTAALLQACGGGGGGDSTPAPVANTAPTNVSLVEVSSAGSTVVTASWLPATDDSTTAANLNYEIHASTNVIQFRCKLHRTVGQQCHRAMLRTTDRADRQGLP